MRTLSTICIIALPLFSLAQVTNEVQVYVRPGTEVHVFENFSNTNSGNVEVDEEGLLYVDGTLVNNGSMTFRNASSLLRGSTGSDATGSGTYLYQRQGSSGSIYNYWSSPMIAHSGVPGGSYLYDPSLGTQDYSDDQPADPGWVSYNGLMTPGRGYAGQGGGLGSFTGEVNNGSVSFPLFYTPDVPGNTAPGTPFNLVGNPYPSGVQASSLVTANPDISGALYFWDDDLSGGSGYSNTDYAVWNFTGSLGTGAGTVGAPNGTISAGQGFKVKAIAPGAVLNFNNGMRVTNTTQFFRMDGGVSRLWLSIEGDNKFNQILIGIIEDATDNEDRLYDATKLRGNQNLSLAATQDGKDYCIMAFPPPSAEKTIPLSVYTDSPGTFTFKANTMENFEYEEVFFFDAITNQEVLLEEGTEIAVSLLEAGEYNGRFYLNFRSNQVTGIEDRNVLDIRIYSYDDELFVGSNSHQRNTAIVELFDLSGKLVLRDDNVTVTPDPTRISIASLANGVYATRLTLNGEAFNAKIVKQ